MSRSLRFVWTYDLETGPSCNLKSHVQKLLLRSVEKKDPLFQTTAKNRRFAQPVFPCQLPVTAAQRRLELQSDTWIPADGEKFNKSNSREQISRTEPGGNCGAVWLNRAKGVRL